MKKSIYSFVLAMGVAGFSGVALAHDVAASTGRDTAPMARATYGAQGTQALGYAGETGRNEQFVGAQAEGGLSDADALLFKLGDRGLGNN